jgi:hypothetical protein
MAALFLAMLAALGLDRLLRARKAPLWPAIAAGVAAFSLFVVGNVLKTSTSIPHGTWSGILDRLAAVSDAGSEVVRSHADREFIARTGLYAGRQLHWAVEMAIYARHTRATTDAFLQYPQF